MKKPIPPLDLFRTVVVRQNVELLLAARQCGGARAAANVALIILRNQGNLVR